MIMFIYQRLTKFILICALGMTALYFSSCHDDDGPGPGPKPYVAPPFSEQQSMFFLSWIAECTSDTAMIQDSLQGLQSLTALGGMQLARAFTNPILVGAFGDYGPAPVWGPALSVSVVGDTAVLTDNLLYVAKSEEGNNINYTVAVAGTNAISFFDWFAEDFHVQDTVAWQGTDGNPQGAIAAGSALGLEILLNLQDQSGTSVTDFIINELSNADPSKNYTIAVTGHSLGGALSPLLALTLKEQLSLKSFPASYEVEAWPYAGPTPGDKDFANYLVSTLDAYHAFNNNYDLVPHAWELDSLERLCDLYLSTEEACSYTEANAYIANGFVQWMVILSDSSGIDYQIAGTPNTFDGTPLPVVADTVCTKVAGIAELITTDTSTTIQELNLILEFIDAACGDTDPVTNLEDNIAYLLLYLMDVDFQHTTAYELQYFPSEVVMDNVDIYFPAGTDELTYATPTLAALLQDVLTDIQNRGADNCECQP